MTGNINMQVSGKAIASVPKFVVKNFGKKGYQTWLDSISADAHMVYAYPIKEDEWYPLRESLVKPCANIAQLFYQWDLQKAAWQLGRFSADFGAKNFYKLFAKTGSVKSFLNKTQEFMASYYKPASIELVESGDTNAMLRITQFPEFDKTIEYRMAGWMERTLEINGCKNIKINVPKSLADFKPCTEFHLSWE
ncbi:MAG: hypothetical protein GY940_19225 [bacterium]|nr:hypothetical protein [bacterium]